MTDNVKRLEQATLRLEMLSPELMTGSGGVHPSITAYDDLIAAKVTPFCATTKAIGGSCTKIGELLENGFKVSRHLVVAARDSKKPDEEETKKAVAPFAAIMEEAQKLINNRDKQFPHQSSFAEFIQCIQWPFINPTPGPFVQGTYEASDFYLNKVLKDFKDAENKADHRAFVKGVKEISAGLQEYIKQFHRSGIAWNPKGGKLSEFSGEAAAASSSGGSSTASMEELLQRLEAAISAVEVKLGGGADDADGVPASIAEYEELLNGVVKEYVENCAKCGEEVAALVCLDFDRGANSQGALADKGFKLLSRWVKAAKECKKPADDVLMAAAAPIAAIIDEANKMKDNRSKHFPHQASFAEFIQCLQWVLIRPAPGPFVQGTLEAGDFYLNKVLKDFKETPEKKNHQAFVRLNKQILKDLQAYIKKHHATGLFWNPKGEGDFASLIK